MKIANKAKKPARRPGIRANVEAPADVHAVATKCGVTANQILKLVKAGVFKRPPGGELDPDECARIFEERFVEGTGRALPGVAKLKQMDLREGIALKRERAKKIRNENRIAAGEIVEVSSVREEWAKHFGQWVHSLASSVDRIAGLCAGLGADKIADILHSEFKLLADGFGEQTAQISFLRARQKKAKSDE